MTRHCARWSRAGHERSMIFTTYTALARRKLPTSAPSSWTPSAPSTVPTELLFFTVVSNQLSLIYKSSVQCDGRDFAVSELAANDTAVVEGGRLVTLGERQIFGSCKSALDRTSAVVSTRADLTAGLRVCLVST